MVNPIIAKAVSYARVGFYFSKMLIMHRARLTFQQVSAAGTAAAKPTWMFARRPAEKSVLS